uniref:Uncharacterized protein n=1 Tax=Kwoniella dejecticola CBS 10117 TaxID=1296121 RepID=A0A1A6AGV9_9TREE|nr:uncharacterized protein I303_01128 [Kwoniella dejecticola CBS 10117]OBR89302.1 hypothetical protein I303_01128 [Kwoniella dejecticola CBS 10117]
MRMVFQSLLVYIWIFASSAIARRIHYNSLSMTRRTTIRTSRQTPAVGRPEPTHLQFIGFISFEGYQTLLIEHGVQGVRIPSRDGCIVDYFNVPWIFHGCYTSFWNKPYSQHIVDDPVYCVESCLLSDGSLAMLPRREGDGWLCVCFREPTEGVLGRRCGPGVWQGYYRRWIFDV